MNIAFDATAILGDLGRNRGIGNYNVNHFNAMIEENPNDNYFCLNFFKDKVVGNYIKNQKNVQEVQLYSGKDNILIRDICYEDIIGDILIKFIKDNHIDFFYVTSPFDTSMYPYKEDWFKNTKVVATVYDLIPYVLKNKYFPNNIGLEFYMERINMLKWMDHFFVISNSVKEDMTKLLDFPEDKITVIWGAADKRFKKVDVKNKEGILKKYGIKNKYIMCTGGDDDRKNIDGLIRAFAKVPEELRDDYEVVIVCKISKESIIRYTNIAKEEQIANKVIFTNFVSDEDLLMLYNCADGMAFVSKYEGFGLPVVEAFACQIPVVTSNNSSLGEIAGDAAITVDPYDVHDIARGLQKLLETANTEEMIQRGAARLKQFNWKQVAEYTLDPLKSIAHEKAKKVRKLAFFTPLPPIQSGISDYSVDILNAISEFFDMIDVFIDEGYDPECVLCDNVHIFNHKKYEPGKYDETIYQVGNSDFHTYMFKYIKKFRGIVELHDCNLHLLVRHISFGKGAYDLPKYRKILSEDMNEGEINQYLHAVDANGFSPYTITINGFVTNYASKIIVHSLWARDWLIKKDFGRDVRSIPLYSKIEPIADKDKFREKLGYEKQDFIIASFGIIHQTKRTIPILKALKKLKDSGYVFKYVFVGKFGGDIEQEYNDTIQKLGLTGVVEVTGFIDMEDFEHYVDISNICVNLRYPYNGETSAACSRILAKGKCVLVNNIGSFCEIPENACVKLPNVEEMSETQEYNTIYNELKKLMDDKKLIRKYELGAREYAVEHLDINKIAQQYCGVINDESYRGIKEELLKRIAIEEIKKKKYSQAEIRQFCESLSYPKQ